MRLAEPRRPQPPDAEACNPRKLGFDLRRLRPAITMGNFPQYRHLSGQPSAAAGTKSTGNYNVLPGYAFSATSSVSIAPFKSSIFST